MISKAARVFQLFFFTSESARCEGEEKYIMITINQSLILMDIYWCWRFTGDSLYLRFQVLQPVPRG